MKTGFVYFARSLFWLPQKYTSTMKLFNIAWATANKGILTKRYILFVCLEGNTSLLCGYMYVTSWDVRIVKNCDRGLENVARGHRSRAAFSSPRSQFFATRTDPKSVNNLFIFSFPSLKSLLLLLNVSTHTSRARYCEKSESR